MFWKKKKQIIKTEKPKNYYFCSNDYTVNYPISEEEQIFLNALCNKSKGFFYKLDRMSDGTIAVWIHEGFVGKIRLCKKKHWMMISKKNFMSMK